MNARKTVNIIMAAVFALPLVLTASETVHLFDQFNERDRDTQNLPQAARWFATNRAGARMVADGSGGYALQLGGGEYIRGAVAYFTQAHAPVVLEEAGDKITLEVDFTPSSQNPGSHSGAIRVALLHSGDDRIRRDELGDVRCNGYGFMIDPQVGVVRYRARDADRQRTGNLISTLGNYTQMHLETGFLTMKQGVTYALKFELERLADDKVRLSATMSDGTVTASGSFEAEQYKFYTFDTVAFGINPQHVGHLIMDNVKITSKK